jgi:hypothetical protein
LINRAIGLSVMCGLLVSLVVAALFISSALGINLLATNSLSFGGVRPTPASVEAAGKAPVAKE